MARRVVWSREAKQDLADIYHYIKSDNPKAAKSVVDVAAQMDKVQAASKEKGLEWRKSIVDLMKLLDLDSSLAARKELAKELHYTGDTKNSSEMNQWLHKQVMNKLAENGGNVPADLRD